MVDATKAAVDLASVGAGILQSDTAWAVVVSMVGIKIMDIWDKRVALRVLQAAKRKRARRRRS